MVEDQHFTYLDLKLVSLGNSKNGQLIEASKQGLYVASCNKDLDFANKKTRRIYVVINDIYYLLFGISCFIPLSYLIEPI